MLSWICDFPQCFVFFPWQSSKVCLSSFLWLSFFVERTPFTFSTHLTGFRAAFKKKQFGVFFPLHLLFLIKADLSIIISSMKITCWNSFAIAEHSKQLRAPRHSNVHHSRQNPLWTTICSQQSLSEWWGGFCFSLTSWPLGRTGTAICSLLWQVGHLLGCQSHPFGIWDAEHGRTRGSVSHCCGISFSLCIQWHL